MDICNYRVVFATKNREYNENNTKGGAWRKYLQGGTKQ